MVTLDLEKGELSDLLLAVRCWISEYTGAAPEEEIKRFEELERMIEYERDRA